MNLTLRMAPEQPLLLPLVSEEHFPLHGNRQPSDSDGEEALCYALIERIAQTHVVTIAEQVGMNSLASRLEHALSYGVTRMLLLPWNLHGATAQIASQAMNALHHTGAGTVSATSLLLTHPATVAGVSPAGPLGGLLPPQPRLDRFVEAWPGWKHVYTVVRSEEIAVLVLHSSKAPSLSALSDRCASGKHRQLKQALAHTLHQNPDQQDERASLLHRDSTIYVNYLSGMVTAALDALYSLPPIAQDSQ